MDLFEHRRAADTAARAPLADRMRPRTLDEFFGQSHIVGPGRLLRRAIEADQLSSLIFYGPPGTGKTTLARIIANTTEAHFTALNAVLAGVKDIRAAVADARERRGMYGRRTILFVDEVHRFNKAQQDALLPWVENGTVVFIGATTENPYFEVNKALVSRSRVFQLRPLETDDLRAIARAVLADDERGYGGMAVELHDDALDHLIDVAGGDARGVLNALELSVETTPPDDRDRVVIDLSVAEESIQRRAVLYDKEGDAHYDIISAFIKSLRGGDPDASLYWLARMVYAGEDPRFIFRRMLILASEDVGLADPHAVGVVAGCARAFDYVGLPEGRFHLAQAALYLATTPKSNSTMAFFDALDAVERERASDVPVHLKDGNRDSEGFGHGAGYLYPHAYRDHWVAQQYLPDSLQGRVFYKPSDQGAEGRVRRDVLRQREAQLAAMLDDDDALAPTEILTSTGAHLTRERDRWLARAVGDAGARLGALRDRVLDSAALSRHSVVLDLRAGTGLLTWEAVRRAPEGGVWALAESEVAADTLIASGAGLAPLDAPTVVVGSMTELADLLTLRGEIDVRFDAAIGRNALARETDRPAAAAAVAALMAPGGRLSLAETVPRAGSRPSALLAEAGAEADLVERARAAEASAYGEAGGGDADARLAWDPDDLVTMLEAGGFEDVAASTAVDAGALVVTQALVDRWFGEDARYGQHLADVLPADEVSRVRRRIESLIGAAAVPWETATVYMSARRR